MKGMIYIEYLDGNIEKKEYNDYFAALNEQRKILKNKKKLETIRVCKVVPC